MITIKDYVETIKKELEQFQNYWELNSRPNSEIFPTHLNIGEWDEQFKFYNDINENNCSCDCDCKH